MNIFQALILAVIQSITEWLPISSSGHLAIAQSIFGLKENLAYDVLLHFATLIVIIIYFYRDILDYLRKPKLIMFIIIGSVPIALLGYFLQDEMQGIFNNLLITAFGLIATSVILFLSDLKFMKSSLSLRSSFGVGLFQALAIFPGVSRSGSTIGGSLLLGLNKEEAIRFSFILAIPALLGAMILNIGEVRSALEPEMIVGFLITIALSYFVLKWLIHLVRKNKLKYFSYYTLGLGIIILALSIF